jgi:methylglutaconyl-CoA hydratase
MSGVTLSIAERIGTITFSNPPHNALPGDILAELAACITRAGQDPLIHVLILQSSGGRTFCAGASFDELIAVTDAQSGKEFFLGFANVINACRKCPKLIIGRIQGKAVGGGVGLASAVDYCIANKYASVKLSELALGIGPFVVGPAVERKVGLSAFTQLSANATEWQTASWAKDRGLFMEVFDTTEQMDAYIAHFAQILAGSSPEAMRALKEALWADCSHWDQLLDERAAISGRLVLSEYTRNAIAAFKAKQTSNLKPQTSNLKPQTSNP